MRKTIKNNWFMLSYVLRYSPIYLILTIGMAFLSGLVSAANILLMRYVIDTANDSGNLELVALFVLAITAMNILIGLAETTLSSIVLTKQQYKIQQKIQIELFSVVNRIQFKYYDNAEFYNQFALALNQAENRALGVAQTVTSFVGNITRISALLSIIISLSPYVVLFILLGVAVSLLIQKGNVKLKQQYVLASQPVQRRGMYVKMTVYNRECAQELRMHPEVQTLLTEKYSAFTNAAMGLVDRFRNRTILYSTGTTTTSAVVNAVSILYLATRLSHGVISVGDFSALLASCTQLYGLANSFFGIGVSFYEHSVYIQQFRDFLALGQQECNWGDMEQIPSQAEIKFDDVSFQYEGDDEKALRHIHLRIAPGEKLAIVGVNGAGKSTLVKLLAGIYSPTEGSILVGGVPISRYREDAYRNAVNMVLQHYALFAFTIGENVLMRHIVSEEDRRIVEEALRAVGLWDKVSALPNGINTEVTREFSSGIILSGGEQQKLALARAYALKSQILILDEPSSSLDAFAETDILRQLYQAGQDKTIILVTHKLMDVKWADRIVVLRDGQIIEEGTHEQLMHLQREYAEMINWGKLGILEEKRDSQLQSYLWRR